MIGTDAAHCQMANVRMTVEAKKNQTNYLCFLPVSSRCSIKESSPGSLSSATARYPETWWDGIGPE